VSVVVGTTTAAAIDHVAAAAYRIPTQTDEESDGTLVWDATTVVVVELRAGDAHGLGYSYAHPAALQVIADKLSGTLLGADPLRAQATWARLHVQLRQLGHAGLAAMALSAVDIALWDLKARLLDVCLADLLPRWHDSVPIYGSGGFTSSPPELLRERARAWTQAGMRQVKIKVGRDKDADLERLAIVRETVGDGVDLMVDANGAYTPKEALAWAQRFAQRGVVWLEEPVTSQDLDGLAFVRARGPAGLAIAAGEYTWNLPDAERMLRADAVDVLQADVSRCGGITNLLRIDGLCQARAMPLSLHCVPAVSAHAGCALQTLLHTEYFHDHVRIERLLFDGTLDPSGGVLTPDRDRPGLGLELRADAADHQLAREERR
jgi:L-alanine-DL-glutamate epimerase-like enolase superfamily enzyme